MNRTEATAIDRAQDILPGGSGEHSFNVLDTARDIDSQLINFAESCGGLYLRDEYETIATLETCDCGCFHIEFYSDLSRVKQVRQDTGFVYWDDTKARVTGVGYQETNAFEAALDEYLDTSD
jgi:hypothetical protein